MDRPWENEPDTLDWEHAGLKCAIRRNPHLGHLCGYAGVPLGHPWHGKRYDDEVSCPDIEAREYDPQRSSPIAMLCAAGKGCVERKMLPIDLFISAHGGVTHAAGDGEYPVEGSDLWWFGFDCAHCDDYTPTHGMSGTVYRDIAYVTAETERLAEQLAAMWKEGD